MAMYTVGTAPMDDSGTLEYFENSLAVDFEFDHELIQSIEE